MDTDFSSQVLKPENTQLCILALGDSYTIGEGVLVEECWPRQLAARLREHGLPVSAPRIIAQTGWTTADLIQALAADTFSEPFDLVTLLIGVNNQYQGRDIHQYRAHFRLLLRQAAHLAADNPERVLVLSIPDWGVTPYAQRGFDRVRIAAEIDQYNQVNRAEALAVRAFYADITPITRLKGSSPGWLAKDGLHPSAKMYAAWVEQILPLVLEMLRNLSNPQEKTPGR